MGSFSFEHLDACDWAGEVAWLRALAASLVRDPEDAADLAGDVWVQALERRPEVGESRPLRAWLTVVSRRLAARRRREGGARREREHAVARRKEGVPPPDESIERVELQRKLVEAVLALDEPYRSAVVLRHLEQLSPAEIALRQGCTSEAARQRIARGLQQLRARLDREFDGGRAGWQAILAPFAGQASLASGVALGGAAVVSSKLAAGLLALVGVLLFCWWRFDFTFQPSAMDRIDPSEIAGALESPADLEGLVPTSSALDARGLADPGDRALRIAGRVVDSRGEPLSGAHVMFVTEDESAIAEVESDAAGRFERFAGAGTIRGAALEAFASCGGFCEVWAKGRLGEELVIVMQRLPRVEVRVVAPDGSPPTGSGLVELTILGKSSGKRSTSLMLDEDGIARSDPLLPGQLVHVRAHFEGFALTDVPRADELGGDAVVNVEIALVRGVTLRGVVIDEATRRPVEGALVRAEPNDPRNASTAPGSTTDGSGRFELRAVTPTRRAWLGEKAQSDLYRVTVEAHEYVLLPKRGDVLKHPASVAPPSLVENLELLLVPAGCELSVTLRRPDGREFGRHVSVRVADASGISFASRANPDGTVKASDLCAGDVHIVAFGEDVFAVGKVTLERGERGALALTLSSTDAAVDVRIVDSNGRGVPGIELGGRGLLGETGLPYMRWSEVTDTQGRARLQRLVPGICEVTATHEDFSGMALWPPYRKLELQAGTLATAEFLAQRAVECSGRLDPDLLFDSSPPMTIELVHAELGSIASSHVHPDGTFAFEGVFDADYVLVAKQDGRELGRLAFPRGGSRDLIIP